MLRDQEPKFTPIQLNCDALFAPAWRASLVQCPCEPVLLQDFPCDRCIDLEEALHFCLEYLQRN